MPALLDSETNDKARKENYEVNIPDKHKCKIFSTRRALLTNFNNTIKRSHIIIK